MSVGCAVGVVAPWSVRVAVLSAVTIASIIVGIVALYVIVGWDVGAVEWVSVVVVVGVTMDYCVHVVHGGANFPTGTRSVSTPCGGATPTCGVWRGCWAVVGCPASRTATSRTATAPPVGRRTLWKPSRRRSCRAA